MGVVAHRVGWECQSCAKSPSIVVMPTVQNVKPVQIQWRNIQGRYSGEIYESDKGKVPQWLMTIADKSRRQVCRNGHLTG